MGVASQGIAINYDATRVRFKLAFSGAEQTVTFRLNADKTGAGGFGIKVAVDTGEVGLTQDGQAVVSKSFGALVPATAYFVEATFVGATAAVVLSKGNYASVPGATVLGELDPTLSSATPTGTQAAIQLSGTGTSIDDLSVARCGTPAPAYKALLRDTFNRASSATPGKPELPATSTWAGDTENISIGSNALTFSNLKGGSITTEQGQHYQGSGLRFRSSAKFSAEGWFILRYNWNPAFSGTPVGFDLWREKDTNVFIEFGAGVGVGDGRYPVALDVNTIYFMQFDIQDGAAVATMRTGSYDGPILFGAFADGFVDTPANLTTFYVGDTWSANLSIDEVYVDQYTP